MTTQVTTKMLEEFSKAWNAHDIDALMSFMHEDCVFEAVAGPEVCGARHSGQEAVRKAFQGAWATIKDAQWLNGVHHVMGDMGVSQTTFTGTNPDGTRIEANMVDVFTFKDGKILVKNAFRKNRPALTPKA